MPRKVGDNSSSLNDYFKVTAGGFFAASLINCLILSFGFLTFGRNSMGVILSNYSTKDVGATICRLLTAISVVGGYPFLVSACRSEILKLWTMNSATKATRRLEKGVTSGLLLCLMMASMMISNAGFVIGFTGAVMGSVLGYILPCFLYLSYTANMMSPMKTTTVLERMFCRILIVFGILAAMAGGIVTILNNYFPNILA
jgi:Transmembrane amino acid transporter protein